MSKEEKISNAYGQVVTLLEGQDNYADFKAFELGYKSRDEEIEYKSQKLEIFAESIFDQNAEIEALKKIIADYKISDEKLISIIDDLEDCLAGDKI